MIKINNTEIEFIKFPDGTCGLFDFNMEDIINKYETNNFNFVWKYESDEEYIRIKYLVDHIREKMGYITNLSLYVPYLPNTRMDRVKNDNEIFTLKYFANFLNSLCFNRVYILDPHSNVTTALINNVSVLSINNYLNKCFYEIMKENRLSSRNNVIVYFPDEGAFKRYKDNICFSENEKLYGKKVRDWETGKILSLDVYNEREEKLNISYDFEIETDIILPLENKVVLMVDDIISYGGTLAYSADKLKELGASDIYAYASHTENSVLDSEKGTLLKRLENETVKRIFTTDSIFNSESEFVKVFKI